MRIFIAIIITLLFGLVFAEEESILIPIEDINEEELGIQVAKFGAETICLSRKQNRQFDLLVLAIQNGDLDRAEQTWTQLVQDLVAQGGTLPNFGALMLTSAREGVVDGHPQLGPAADKLLFDTQRLRIIREELVLLEARIDESNDQSEVDRLQLEKENREIELAQQEQAAEDAEQNYRDAQEKFETALEIIVETVERQTQALLKTQGI